MRYDPRLIVAAAIVFLVAIVLFLLVLDIV
jgi:preprotein translocase subunit Sec61beta